MIIMDTVAYRAFLRSNTISLPIILGRQALMLVRHSLKAEAVLIMKILKLLAKLSFFYTQTLKKDTHNI
jgi:hypothetical protein